MKTLEKIGLDRIQHFTIPEAARELPLNQVKNIIGQLFEAYITRYSALKVYFPVSELLALDWSWQEAGGKTLPQRIDRTLQRFGIVLPTEIFGNIGNELRESLPLSEEYMFDIVNKFDWKDGTFGDKGSCMWDGRRSVKDEMEVDGRFHALRFFTLDAIKREGVFGEMRTPVHRVGTVTYYGLGRAWLFTDIVQMRSKTSLVRERIYLLFNSYGKPLREMTAVFAALVGGSFKKVRISNRKKVGGGLYTNGPGYIIGPLEVIENIEHYDFSFENSYDVRKEQQASTPDSRYEAQVQQNLARSIFGTAWYGVGPRREPKKVYWVPKDKQKSKKQQNTSKKGPANQPPAVQRSHTENRQNLYNILHWEKDCWYNTRSIKHPNTTLYFFRKWYERLDGDLWRILLRLITININGGIKNDTTKNEGGHPPECKTQTPESPLWRDEGDVSYEVISDSF